jgi:dynein intermediate chain 2
MEHCIKQNNAIDIYEEYFAPGAESLSATSAYAKSVNVFRDPNPVARPASSVSWYPDDGHKIAVAYSCLEFQKSPAGVSLDSYIWDVENPNEPDMTLTPTSPISCLKYNFKDPHILVGGYYNGLVGMCSD